MGGGYIECSRGQNPQNAQGFLGILVLPVFLNYGIWGQNPQIAHFPTFTPDMSKIPRMHTNRQYFMKEFS